MGRIVTVSDGAGRSVTVSNWGVAQSSRYHHFTHESRLQQGANLVCDYKLIGLRSVQIIEYCTTICVQNCSMDYTDSSVDNMESVCSHFFMN
jgi:hypothetical protein